ncbi:hypothetical protein SprV_0602066000 [Sparganum proliferum]
MADISKPFWHCSKNYYWPEALDICAIHLEVFGFTANLTVTILLFRLRSKKTEGLALLRVLSLSCLVSTLINLAGDIGEFGTNTGNTFFDGLVCIFWSSRFLFWYTNAHIFNSLFYFACNRAFEMLQIKNYPITTEKQRLTAYMLLVFIGSFLSTAPQLLLARPHVKNCACALPTRNLVILTIIYAHTFLWVAIYGLIYPAILVYICIALVLRARSSGRSALVNELDQLYFPNTRSSSSSSSPPSDTASAHPVSSSTICEPCDSAAPTNKFGDDFDSYVWPASFCIIPLTAAYIATFSYDATYQFLSATGKLTYVLRSPTQQFGEFLLLLFSTLVPLIIFFHIPAMRSLIFVAIASVQKKCGKSMLREAGGQLD